MNDHEMRKAIGTCGCMLSCPNVT